MCRGVFYSVNDNTVCYGAGVNCREENLCCAVCEGGGYCTFAVTAADIVSVWVSNRFYRTAAYGDICSAAATAAAYTCCIYSAFCGNNAAADGDI